MEQLRIMVLEAASFNEYENLEAAVKAVYQQNPELHLSDFGVQTFEGLCILLIKTYPKDFFNF